MHARFWKLGKSVAGLAIGLTLGLVLAPGPAHAVCQIYEGPSFSGQALTISDNSARADLGNMNDKVSSVKISPQCLMQAYADPDFKGAQTTFSPGEHPRLMEGWDDQISSARCNCR